jgi:hypothetical protein
MTNATPIHRSIDLYDEEGHPDARPCPSWCGGVHVIDPVHPYDATHRPEAFGSVAASCYPGTRGPEGHIEGASFDLELEQIGQAAPTIRLWLNAAADGDMARRPLAVLSLDDVRELAAYFIHVYNIANGTGRQTWNGASR